MRRDASEEIDRDAYLCVMAELQPPPSTDREPRLHAPGPVHGGVAVTPVWRLLCLLDAHPRSFLDPVARVEHDQITPR